MAFLILIPLVFVMASLVVIWVVTENPRFRFAFALAAIGSSVLFIATVLLSFCGLVENRSELFNARCEGGVPVIPLVGIPALFFLASKAEKLPMPFLLSIGIGTFLAALMVPWQLLSV